MEFDSLAQRNHMMSVPGSFKTNPGYFDLANDSWTCIRHYYLEPTMWEGYKFPKHVLRDLNRLFHMNSNELCTIVLWAILLTIIRIGFERIPCRFLMNRLGIKNSRNRHKFQESAFKGLFYLMTWTSVYWCLTRVDRHNLFANPWKMWDDWSVGMRIDPLAKKIYFIEAGFYIHSVYASIYMDVIRRDFPVIMVHHCVTIILLVCSYGVRYHRMGLLVILCHDVNDVFLEFTKALDNIRNAKYEKVIETSRIIGFAIFTASWIYFRLYKFPLGVIYGTMVVSCYQAYQKNAGLYGPLNCLLLLILVLDMYWFWYITRIIINKLMGDRLDDIREYEESPKNKKVLRNKNGLIRRF